MSKCIAKFHREECATQCGYTMKMSSSYHRLLTCDVKSTTKTDSMGPFKLITVKVVVLGQFCCSFQFEFHSRTQRRHLPTITSFLQ